jgi:cobalt-zinc-cadmium efflux system outer membrane protein
MIALEADEAAALARLKGLLGMQKTAKLAITGSLAATIAQLRASTKGRTLYRPDLVRTSLEADAAGAEIALARAETWEDITVGVEYEFEKMANGEMGIMDVNFLGVRVNIPLPAWNRNQGKIAEQSASRQRARRDLIAAKIMIEAEIEAARVRSAKSAAVADSIAMDSIPLLDETLRILDNAIQTGQADTSDAITLSNQEIEQRLFFVEAQASEAGSLSDLEAALGANRYLNRDIFVHSLQDGKPDFVHPAPARKSSSTR